MQIRFEPFSLKSVANAEAIQRLIPRLLPRDFLGRVVVSQSSKDRSLYIRIRDGRERTVVKVIEPDWFYSRGYQPMLESVIVELCEAYDATAKSSGTENAASFSV